MSRISTANRATIENAAETIRMEKGVTLPRIMQERTAAKLRDFAADHNRGEDFVTAAAAERMPCRATLIRYGILDNEPTIFEWFYLEGQEAAAAPMSRAEYHLTNKWRLRIAALLMAYGKD